MKEKLVILSIPFQRINRVLLGPHVLNLLDDGIEIMIVSPFANDPAFQNEFQGSAIKFLQSVIPEKIKRPYDNLYSISEIFRMQGYWRRNRNRGMAEFLANCDVQYNDVEGQLKRPLYRRIVFSLLRIIGMWPKSWVIIDNIIGKSIFKFPELTELTNQYKQVTLIQSASWGFQDRMMAWIGKQEKWRSILIPYTTDQIHSNGYLLSDFDIICVQGPAEERFAKNLHNISPERIKKLGSAWLRHIEVIEKGLPRMETQSEKSIMFAGIAGMFFPLQSQFDIVDKLLLEINSGNLGKVNLILRPVALDITEMEDWSRRYNTFSNVTIQWPQAACLGIDFDPSVETPSMQSELVEFVKQLSGIDLLVLSGFTTLIIEAAHFNIPSISVFSDRTGILENRNSDLMIKTVVNSLGFNSLPIIHDLDKLGEMVNEILEDPVKAKQISDGIIYGWDYPDSDFNHILKEALFDNRC